MCKQADTSHGGSRSQQHTHYIHMILVSTLHQQKNLHFAFGGNGVSNIIIEVVLALRASFAHIIIALAPTRTRPTLQPPDFRRHHHSLELL